MDHFRSGAQKSLTYSLGEFLRSTRYRRLETYKKVTRGYVKFLLIDEFIHLFLLDSLSNSVGCFPLLFIGLLPYAFGASVCPSRFPLLRVTSGMPLDLRICFAKLSNLKLSCHITSDEEQNSPWMSMLLNRGSPGGEGIASNPERHGHASVVDYFVAFDLFH